MFSELSSKITEGIRVSVRSAYIPEESSPRHSHYVFAYQVHIENESPYTVQLLSRKWIITNGTGQKQIVEGDGVIGKQPTLNPGEIHEYVSGCNFTTPIGKMEGHYLMVRKADGSKFRVRIPAFTMAAPEVLN